MYSNKMNLKTSQNRTQQEDDYLLPNTVSSLFSNNTRGTKFLHIAGYSLAFRCRGSIQEVKLNLAKIKRECIHFSYQNPRDMHFDVQEPSGDSCH